MRTVIPTYYYYLSVCVVIFAFLPVLHFMILSQVKNILRYFEARGYVPFRTTSESLKIYPYFSDPFKNMTHL